MIKRKGKTFFLITVLATMLAAGGEASPPERQPVELLIMTGEMTGGRLLVPLRDIFAVLGAEVNWDGEGRTVTAGKGELVVSLTIDSPIALVNRQEIELDALVRLVDGRTYVPARLVSEVFGTRVDWIQEIGAAKITREGQPVFVKPSYACMAPGSGAIAGEPTHLLVLVNKHRWLSPDYWPPDLVEPDIPFSITGNLPARLVRCTIFVGIWIRVYW